MNDILSIAVWAAIRSTPRTMHRWPSTEYTIAWSIDDAWVHPSTALLEMERTEDHDDLLARIFSEHGRFDAEVW